MIIIDCTFVHFLCRQDDIVMFLTKVTENKMMKKKKNPIHQSIDKITDRLRPVLVGHRTGVNPFRSGHTPGASLKSS